MGNCTCKELVFGQQENARPTIPDPVAFKTGRFVMLHYAETQTVYSSFECLKKALVDCVIVEVVRFGYLGVDSTVVTSVVLVKGISLHPSSPHMEMVIGVFDGKLLIQYGRVSAIQLLLNFHRKRILTRYKPQTLNWTLSMVALVDLLYKHAEAAALSSPKSIMRFIKRSVGNCLP